MQQKPYLNPYLAGILLGLVILLSFFLSGRGLGASGGVSTIIASGVHAVAPTFAEAHPYFGKYFDKATDGHANAWKVFLFFGVLVGGFLSGIFSGRVRKDLERGPNISARSRLLLAFVGGIVMGFGARLARGCASGQGLSGAAVFASGSWLFLLALFAGAFAAAYFVRRQWI
ncbi:MAG: YeeE/YedE thiosulfate transporter family protein [Candidatus Lernaella stagnicola]|nr:YeeE/YedE thiosulfate transporter family protein [Candidatus Lernaella stagnicola]